MKLFQLISVIAFLFCKNLSAQRYYSEDEEKNLLRKQKIYSAANKVPRIHELLRRVSFKSGEIKKGNFKEIVKAPENEKKIRITYGFRNVDNNSNIEFSEMVILVGKENKVKLKIGEKIVNTRNFPNFKIAPFLKKVDLIFKSPHPVKNSKWIDPTQNFPPIIFEAIDSEENYSWAIRTQESVPFEEYLPALNLVLLDLYQKTMPKR